jgi:hypothetical protein
VVVAKIVEVVYSGAEVVVGLAPLSEVVVAVAVASGSETLSLAVAVASGSETLSLAVAVASGSETLSLAEAVAVVEGSAVLVSSSVIVVDVVL